MQLIIELNESDLVPIAENAIKSLLRNDQYGGTGEAAEYIKRQTRYALMEQLRNIDLYGKVQGIATTCFNDIIEDIVRQEIIRVAKKTVKELKDKGELLTNT
jgi:hypothetical protein